MNLTIGQEEAEVLRRVLSSLLPHLEQEAYAGDSLSWRIEDEGAELVVKSFVERLDAARAGSGTT